MHVDLLRAPLLPGRENVLEVTSWNRDGYLASRGVKVAWTQDRPSYPAAVPEVYLILAGVLAYSPAKSWPIRPKRSPL